MAVTKVFIPFGSNDFLLFFVVAPDFKNYIIGTFVILTAIIISCVSIYKIFKVDIVLWYRDSFSHFLPPKGIILYPHEMFFSEELKMTPSIFTEGF